jgi:CHAT domain-containing protein
LEDRLAEAEEEWDRLIMEIRRATPRYAAIRYPEPVSADDARALLDPATALVSYSVRPDRTLVFLMTRDGLKMVRLPVSAASLTERIENYVGLIARDDRDSWRLLSGSLYADLVATFRRQLPTSIRHLIIVPDGVLHSLPFETLGPPDRGARRLAEEFTISYAPSATVLAQLAPGGPGPTDGGAAELLVLASPPIPRAISRAQGEVDGERFDLDPLPYARDEAKAVSRFGGSGSEVHIGSEASEARVLTTGLRRFDVIHFATHALLNRNVPSRSALVLAGGSGGETGDGLLRARDIYRLKLRSELVVLSSCRTARGRILPGEGVQGLAHAFFHAGARSVVASLWDVSDRRTADLMSMFYAHLASGEPKAKALQSAKLDMLRREPQLAPRYWAAFVLIGDPTGKIRLIQPHIGFGWGAAGVAVAGVSAGFWAFAKRRKRKISDAA